MVIGAFLFYILSGLFCNLFVSYYISTLGKSFKRIGGFYVALQQNASHGIDIHHIGFADSQRVLDSGSLAFTQID